ncbi:MAG: hypothetical protein WA708_05685 [Acidobacteriaceae bacterium]
MHNFKHALVQSFVATVALGWVFAAAIQHLADAFVAPLRNFIFHRQFSGIVQREIGRSGIAVQDGAPDLLLAFLLLLIGYFLLRWLFPSAGTNSAIAFEKQIESSE